MTTSGQRTVIRIAGELDRLSVPALLRRLPGPQDCSAQVVLDLSRVTFCGLAGLDLLLELHHRMTGAARAFVVGAANGTVLRTVRLSRDPVAAQLLRTCAAEHRTEHSPHHAVLLEALAFAQRITGAPLGNAQAYDPATGALRIVRQRGFARPFLSFFETVSDRESTCGVAAQDRCPIYVEEVTSSPLYLGTASLDVLCDVPVGSVASLPILGPAGVLIGVISVHRHRSSRWSEDHRRTLGALARSAGQLFPPS
ncbi:GAF domain-containing protein [Streptomyces sp. NPDC047117]|uniref:GAF domain-containing protein n=1 Tax=Streptomyces sp. NPDC047117 TaxID=3155379 RepID=UPI0033CE68D3